MPSQPSDAPQSGIARRRQAAKREPNQEYVAKRAALVRAAADAFVEKGYDAVTLNDIAERLGTDRASLYYYVASKEELLQETVQGTIDANVKELERILKLDLSARDRLHQLIVVLVTSYEADYPYSYVYIQEDMRKVGSDDSPWAKQMTRQTRRVEAIAAKLIQEGIAAGELRDDVDPKLAANALFGMVNWTHRWFSPKRKLTAEEVADAFSAIFFDGFAR